MFRLLHFNIFVIFVNFAIIVGLPSLVRPEQLPCFHVLLVSFDNFSIFVIFATFMGPPSLSVLRIAIYVCLPCMICHLVIVVILAIFVLSVEPPSLGPCPPSRTFIL